MAARIRSRSSRRSGYASPITSITVAAVSTRNGSRRPRSRPWRTARRMIRRKTYPLPSFEGRIPSAIRKVIARLWSAITW